MDDIKVLDKNEKETPIQAVRIYSNYIGIKFGIEKCANSNYTIAEIGQNTEKSPEGLRRLVVTQTPLKDYQLSLIWKTLKKRK